MFRQEDYILWNKNEDKRLNYMRLNQRSLYSSMKAILNMSKAFDSVSFQTMCGSLSSNFIKYIGRYYDGSLTPFTGYVSKSFIERKVVKQLPPLFFILIIDRLLGSLHIEIGMILYITKINARTYANDLNFFSNDAKRSPISSRLHDSISRSI